MSFKQLLIGSTILVFSFVFLSMGVNNILDKSIEFGEARQSNGNPVVPTAVTDKPMKAVDHQQAQGPASLVESKSQILLRDSTESKGFFTTIIEQGISKAAELINPPVEEASTDSLGGQYPEYQALLDQHPLSPEDEALLSEYTDLSPMELIVSYCENSKSPEFKEMTHSIKKSYHNDPSSPAALMEMFETMASLCP